MPRGARALARGHRAANGGAHREQHGSVEPPEQNLKKKNRARRPAWMQNHLGKQSGGGGGQTKKSTWVTWEMRRQADKAPQRAQSARPTLPTIQQSNRGLPDIEAGR